MVDNIQRIGPAHHWINFDRPIDGVPGIWVYTLVVHTVDGDDQAFITTAILGEEAVGSTEVLDRTWQQLECELDEAVRRANGAFS